MVFSPLSKSFGKVVEVVWGSRCDGAMTRVQAACARLSAARSILRICSIDRMTRCAVSEFSSLSISGSAFGMTCHERPNLSFSQGHGLVELEMRPAVESQEFLPFHLELHRHDRSGLLAVNLESLFSITADFPDLGVFEDGSIKFRRFFGLRIEP